VVTQLRAERTRALVIDETVRCILDEGFAAGSRWPADGRR
jgi:hypothetical protein